MKRCVGSKGDYLKRVGSGGLLQRLKRHDEAWMDRSLFQNIGGDAGLCMYTQCLRLTPVTVFPETELLNLMEAKPRAKE